MFGKYRRYQLIKQCVKNSDCPVQYRDQLTGYIIFFDTLFEETKKSFKYENPNELVAFFSIYYYLLDIQLDYPYFESRLGFYDDSLGNIDTINSWNLFNEFEDITMIAIENYGKSKLISLDKTYDYSKFISLVEHLKSMKIVYQQDYENVDFLIEYLFCFILTDSALSIDPFDSLKDKKIQMNKLEKLEILMFGRYELVEALKLYLMKVVLPLLKRCHENKESCGYRFLKRIKVEKSK